MNTNLLNTTSLEKNSVSFYPNPTYDVVNFKNSASNPIENSVIYAVDGKLLFTVDGGAQKISLENFLDGIYFIQVKYKNGQADTLKIIKN